MRWRVPGKMPFIKAAGAAMFAIVALLFHGDLAQVAIAGAAAVALGLFALRDVVAPERLAVDETGVTVVTGFAGRRVLAWSEVERVRLDSRQRWGRRVELVEIDAGEDLYLFSTHELGAPCHEVVETLREYQAIGALRGTGGSSEDADLRDAHDHQGGE